LPSKYLLLELSIRVNNLIKGILQTIVTIA